MSPENFAQRGVNKMRRGVIPPGRVALFHVDYGSHLVTDFYRAALHFRFVQDQTGDRGKSVDDLNLGERVSTACGSGSVIRRAPVATAPGSDKNAGIADLSTRLGIV